MSTSSIPVPIRKTKAEWRIIRTIFKDNKSLSSYIRSEAFKLEQKISQCENCVASELGDKIRERPYLDASTYEELKRIACLMNVSVADVVDNLIITPMLQRRAIGS